MSKEEMNRLIVACDKFLNRYLLRGTDFVEYACFQYGKYNAFISGEPDAHFISDFQYFVFTKSTKSLKAIRMLLHQGYMEDVMILLRTMFEGYLASRYIDENYDAKLLNDFIFVPQLIAHRKVIYQDGVAKERLSNEIIEFIQRDPSKLKLGKDKSYFTDLYAYMCNYAHCNFSILACYINEHGAFTCSKETNALLVRVLVLFVYTKIFENVVTVEGEDFLDERSEKECYKLVKDATLFIYKRLEYFSKYDSNVNEELNKHMKNMFKYMKNSLKEEVRSVKKDFLTGT
ncbi:DUF5677 domain-containing protein [Anaerosporobacter sp.]